MSFFTQYCQLTNVKIMIKIIILIQLKKINSSRPINRCQSLWMKGWWEPAIHIVHEFHTIGVIITRQKNLSLEKSGCHHLNAVINLIILHSKTARHICFLVWCNMKQHGITCGYSCQKYLNGAWADYLHLIFI